MNVFDRELLSERVVAKNENKISLIYWFWQIDLKYVHLDRNFRLNKVQVKPLNDECGCNA